MHLTQLSAEAKLGEAQPGSPARLGIVEYTVAFDDNKTHLRRVLLGEFAEQAAFDAAVETDVGQVEGKY